MELDLEERPAHVEQHVPVPSAGALWSTARPELALEGRLTGVPPDDVGDASKKAA